MKPTILYKLLIVVACLLFSSPIMAQERFEEFERRTMEQFDDFSRRKQLEFAEFMRQTWIEFEMLPGKEKPTPTPFVPPVFDPALQPPETELPTLPHVEEIPVVVENPPLDMPTPLDGATYEEASFHFLGHSMTIKYDMKCKYTLNVISEDKVADFWATLTSTSYDELVYQCDIVKKALELNDWGCYLFVKELANNMYAPHQANEKIVFMAFLLDVYNYSVRVALDTNNNCLMLLTAIEDEVYSTPYILIAEQRYYAPEYTNNCVGIKSYDTTFSKEDKKKFQLTMFSPIKPKHDVKTKAIYSATLDKYFNIEYNTHAIDFYKLMLPAANLSVYFNSKCSKEVTQSLTDALSKYMEGKTEVEQVNFLLTFIHQGFDYMTDDEQFGYERFFFYEELFAYPYNDCEDRAVLFAFLVRKLTALDVVGLLYHDHASVAVSFSEPVHGSYVSHKGEKFVICDPTYMGASVGACMPDYVSLSAEIIEVR